MEVLLRLFADVAVSVPEGGVETEAFSAFEQCLARREIRGKVSPQDIWRELRGTLPYLSCQSVYFGKLDTSIGPPTQRGRIGSPSGLAFFVRYSLAFGGIFILGALVATQLEAELRWLP